MTSTTTTVIPLGSGHGWRIVTLTVMARPGVLGYDQTSKLLLSLGYNAGLLGMAGDFHRARCAGQWWGQRRALVGAGRVWLWHAWPDA